MATGLKFLLAVAVAYLLIAPAKAQPLDSPVSPIALPQVRSMPASLTTPKIVAYGYWTLKR